MNLLEMARMVRSEVGRSGGGPITVVGAVDNDLRVVNAVRTAWLSLQMEGRNWRWQRKSIDTGVLQPGVMAYSATDLDPAVTRFERWWPMSRDVRPVVYDLAQPLRYWELWPIDYDRFRHGFMLGPVASSSPQYCAEAPDGRLLVGPPPDSSATYRLRIDYKSSPKPLLVDADEPDMPASFHMLLVWRALMQYATHEADQANYVRARDNEAELHTALVLSQAEPIRFDHSPLA